MMTFAHTCLVGLLLVCACSDESSGAEEGLDFPRSYRDTFLEVRSCRPSGDHDLNNVRVFASPDAAQSYVEHTGTFGEGSVLLKEEYGFGDSDCSGAVDSWTSMRRTAKSASDANGWSWARVSPSRTLIEKDGARCINCHLSCGGPPNGFEGACGEQ